jgi:dTDP-4-dehydrorhamnose reductase
MASNILLTGGSGLLGKELQKYITCITPSSKELDVTTRPIKPDERVKAIIHCAAYTDVANAEKEKLKCFKVNAEGTYNLLEAYPYVYFVYISSEYVRNPVNFYSYTKLWGEQIVKRYSNDYLIIRTLFKPKPFPYDFAFFDQHTTGDYVDVIAPMIVKEIMKRTQGTIDIGTGRKTMFELARRTKPNVKGIPVDDIKDVELPKDYLCE